jgi:hypothetical protein
MSGLAAADYSLTSNPVPAHEDSSSPDDHPAKAFPGRWIVPFGTLGAANCFFYDLVHLCHADPSLPGVAPSIASLICIKFYQKV